GLGEILLPPMGIIDIDSVPPATITSAPPLMMRSAAMAIACKPEEQNRLIVTADPSTGSPARSEAMRATFIPCSASGMAQPRMTSSISLGSSCGTRSSAPLIATAANSSGRVARSVPLYARPTGVRTEETTTTSRMGQFYSAEASCGDGVVWGRAPRPSKPSAARQRLHRPRKNAALHLILGGAAVHRCDKQILYLRLVPTLNSPKLWSERAHPNDGTQHDKF